MFFWPSVFVGRPGVPRPNNHTFHRNSCFFGLAVFGGQAKTPFVSGICVFLPWYPRPPNTTWPTKTFRDPFESRTAGGFLCWRGQSLKAVLVCSISRFSRSRQCPTRAYTLDRARGLVEPSCSLTVCGPCHSSSRPAHDPLESRLFCHTSCERFCIEVWPG